MLLGTTPRTAAAIRRKLGDVGTVGKASSGALARGVTWVKVTGAISSGWYPGVVSLDLDGTFADESGAVEVKEAAGGTLINGNRYPCTRTADKSDGTPRFRTVPVPAAPALSNQRVFFSTAYSITADNTWEDTSASGNDITLPSAGTYFLFATLTANANISAGGPASISFRLFDETAGDVVGSLISTSYQVRCVTVQGTSGNHTGTGTLAILYTVSEASVLRVDALRTAATWTNAQILTGNSMAVYGYLKLS
jgi:hypothetical protein